MYASSSTFVQEFNPHSYTVYIRNGFNCQSVQCYHYFLTVLQDLFMHKVRQFHFEIQDLFGCSAKPFSCDVEIKHADQITILPIEVEVGLREWEMLKILKILREWEWEWEMLREWE